MGKQTRLALRVHSVRQNPKGADRSFITYEVPIGYAFPEQERLLLAMRSNKTSSQIVRLDVSLNEAIFAAELYRLDADSSIRVSSLEDILAEKLRALLQQPIRNRSRRQNLLDIAVTVTQHRDIDRISFAAFLLRKAAIRNVAVSHFAFQHSAIWE